MVKIIIAAQRVPHLAAAFSPGLENGQPKSLLAPAQVTGGSGPQLVRLAGLNLSRAWCMLQIAAALPKDDPTRKTR